MFKLKGIRFKRVQWLIDVSALCFSRELTTDFRFDMIEKHNSLTHIRKNGPTIQWDRNLNDVQMYRASSRGYICPNVAGILPGVHLSKCSDHPPGGIFVQM